MRSHNCDAASRQVVQRGFKIRFRQQEEISKAVLRPVSVTCARADFSNTARAG